MNIHYFIAFLGGFFLKPKLSKSFLCFHFDIYFKINLALLLGFKVINLKNLHSKNLKGKFNIFIVEFPTSNFIFVISYLCKKRLNHVFLFFLFSLKKSIEVHLIDRRYFYCIFATHMMTSICEKKISAEVRLIHAEQMSLWNFIIL